MNESSDQIFFNATRQSIRRWGGSASAMIVIGGSLLAIGLLAKSDTNWRPLGLIVGFVLLCLSVGPLLASLGMIPQARRTDRLFAEYAVGNYLAKWEFPPEFWRAHVEAEYRRRRKMVRTILLVTLGFGVVIGAIFGYAWPADLRGKLGGAAIGLSIGVGLAAIFGLPMHYASVTRQLRMSGLPLAFIGKTSAYCGGDLVEWNIRRRTLHAQIVPGDPPLLQLHVHIDAPSAAKAADMAMLAVGRPVYTSAGADQWLRIPVPLGMEAAAKEVLLMIENAGS